MFSDIIGKGSFQPDCVASPIVLNKACKANYLYKTQESLAQMNEFYH